MLILTEKPSVAKDFAKALGCDFRSGCYSNGQTEITNCVGHLFRLQEPDFYDPRFKSWKEIPCIPENFSYTVNEGVTKQADLVTRLLNKHLYDTILIATDADREGEVIARECLAQAGITDTSRIRRFWVSQALTPEVIREGMKNARPLSEYDRLSQNGFGRQHSDWLCGMNLTRYVSVAANKKLPVGRVKTAVLSTIETRCSQIENFKSEKYYEHYGLFGAQRCAPSCKGIYFEDENKTQFTDNSKETALKSEVGNKASVIKNKTEKKETPAPQLYNLNALQKDAFKQYGYTAEETLSVIQKLYEEYKCVSYPRTPSKVMGSGNVGLVNRVFDELSKSYSDFSEARKISDISLNNKRCFNDAKLEAHHALIPLKDIPSDASESERNIYNLILNRFKIAFAEAFVYNRQTVILSVSGRKFRITGNQTVNPGWKAFSSAPVRSDDDDAKDETESQSLENIDWNNLTLSEIETKEKWTKPPKYFNEASILSFMENPKSEDEGTGKLIGLGTPATRHTFIPELKANGYIKIEKKNILVTKLGRTLIKAVRSSPLKSFADIAETTNWERRLEENPLLFETEMGTFIRSSVTVPFEIELPIDEESLSCPLCKKEVRRGKSNWYCTGYKDGCDFKIWESISGAKLTDRDVSALLSGKTTGVKHATSKSGKPFDCRFKLGSAGKIEFVFENKGRK